VRLASVACALAVSACVPGAARAPSIYDAPPVKTEHAAAYRIVPSGCAREEPGAIVFLHGLGDVAATWAPVVDRLASCRPRVLVDMPSEDVSAGSVLGALSDLIDRASPNAPIVLVGHSMGGTIAVRLAARRPERVAALVVIGAPLRPFELSSGQRFVVENAALLAPLVRAYGMSATSRGLLRNHTEREGVVDDGHVALIARQLADAEYRIALQDYVRSFVYEDALRVAHSDTDVVTCPVWSISGDADGFDAYEGSFAHAQSVQRRTIPRAGHLAMLDAPAEIAAAVDEAANAPGEKQPPKATAPHTVEWGTWDELHPVIGVSSFVHRGTWDHAALLGVARGSIDRRWPLEAGRAVALVGASARDGDFAYLRATARAELVWRWAGGLMLDGTFALDPSRGDAGGFGSIGYVPSVIPWVRAFAGVGALPHDRFGPLFGAEIDLRFTGILY
jgi:pimeloyl-ACP methyl ester carboxylesterase